MTCSDGYICHRGLAYEMAELADDFSQNSFFITPPKKWQEGRVPGSRPESVFKIGEIEKNQQRKI